LFGQLHQAALDRIPVAILSLLDSVAWHT
jgi:hypothetical protein